MNCLLLASVEWERPKLPFHCFEILRFWLNRGAVRRQRITGRCHGFFPCYDNERSNQAFQGAATWKGLVAGHCGRTRELNLQQRLSHKDQTGSPTDGGPRVRLVVSLPPPIALWRMTLVAHGSGVNAAHGTPASFAAFILKSDPFGRPIDGGCHDGEPTA